MAKLTDEDKVITGSHRTTGEIFRKTNFKTKQITPYQDVYDQIEVLRRKNSELEIQNKKLSNAFSQFEIHYLDLYDFAPLSALTLNQRGIITEINVAGTKLLGLKKSDIINKVSFSRYISVESQNIFKNHCETLEKDAGIHSCELRLLRKNGPIFYAEMTSKKCLNRITKEKHLFVFINDITNRKEAELYSHENYNKLASFDRAISLERFSAVMAHELKHPLTIICNYLYGCIRRLEKKDFDVQEILQIMQKTILYSQRANDVILRMKNFNCKGTLKLEEICLNKIISEVINLIQHEIGSSPVNFIFLSCAKNLNVLVDKIHIEQAIINLIRNSIESMQDANTINSIIKIEINQISKDRVEINIDDNGPGIPEHYRHQIFDPHFTTKSYGIGLGLAVTRNIIQSHGGEIKVVEPLISGVSFKITLPVKSIPAHNDKKG